MALLCRVYICKQGDTGRYGEIQGELAMTIMTGLVAHTTALALSQGLQKMLLGGGHLHMEHHPVPPQALYDFLLVDLMKCQLD